MRLRLKEDPKEWRHFALLTAGVALAFVLLLFARKKIAIRTVEIAGAIAFIIALLAIVSPALFRPFYRIGMTLSFRIGQVVQTILLTLVYFLAVVPLGLLLKAFGKDLLGISQKNSATYWKKARPFNSLDRQF